MPEIDLIKAPPQDLAAEQAVLGAVFLDSERLVEIKEFLSSDDFYKNAHKIIFRTMEKLSDAQIEHVLKGGLLLESEILDNHISEKYDEFKEALNKMNARIAKSESIIIQRKCENQTWKRRNKNTKV